MSTVYQRRVEQEWRLLQLLANTNPAIIESVRRAQEVRGAVFSFSLQRTRALVGSLGDFQFRDSHAVMLHFPEFFPSVPIEASLVSPVFHPNVHPENGFVCLWGRFTPGDTVREAVSQLQRVITWELLNEESDHLMQPAAIAWYKDALRDIELPLRYEAVSKPAEFQEQRTYALRPPRSHRRRLD